MKIISLLCLLGLSFSSFPFSGASASPLSAKGKGTIVAYVPEEARGVKVSPMLTPSDGKYSTQKSYSMNNLGDIEAVWDTYTGKGVKVAVIDDGFATDHPEFTRSDGSSVITSDSAYFSTSGNYVTRTLYSNDPDCIKESYNDEEGEWDSHGTGTATTLLAPMGNGGIVGIAPEAELLCLKVDMSVASINSAISYAIDCGADVINMSLGIYADTFTDEFGDYQNGWSSASTYFNSATSAAKNAGIIVVAAAGNEATSHHSYPACCKGVIGVGALAKNSSTSLSGYTNYNSASESGEKNVDILAPGTVYSATITGSSSASYSTGYSSMNGTSFASPIVAGAAALWKQKNPDGTPDEFLSDLQSSASNIGSFVNKYVDTTTFGGSSRVGPSNITDGTLDVGNLLTFSRSVTGITVYPETLSLTVGGSHTSDTILAEVEPANADNTTIHYSVDHPEIVSIDKETSTGLGEITITALASGKATITATSEDGGYSAACEVTVSEFVPVSSVSLTDEKGETSSSLSIGESLQLSMEVSPQNATNSSYTLVSSNPSVASVNESGKVSALSVGSTVITMTVNDEGNTLTADYNLTVREIEGVSSLLLNCYDKSTLSSTETTAISLNSLRSQLSMGSSNAGNLLTSFSSSTAYARKGGISLGTGSKVGTLTLTFDESVSIVSAAIIGRVWDSNGSLSINGLPGEGSLGSSSATLSEVTSRLTFSSLGGTNVLTIKGCTSSSLTATSDTRATIFQLLLSVQAVEAESITLDHSSLSLDTKFQTTATLIPTISPSGASGSELAWSSSNPDVASVDNGVVTALKEGATTIRVEIVSLPSVYATCEVKVITPIPTSLLLKGLPETIPFASTFDPSILSVEVLYNKGKTVAVENPLFGTVDTSSLGEHVFTYQATVDGILLQGSSKYRVTLNGANIGDSEKAVEDTSESRFSNLSWGTSSGPSWISGKDGLGYTNNGVQVSTGTSGASATTKDSFSSVSKVTVHYCTNNKAGKGSIEIAINGTTQSANITAPTSGGTSEKTVDLSFEGRPTGNVKITVTCSTNSIYIIGVDITSMTTAGVDYDASPLDAAKAYSAYFLSLITPSCDGNGVNSDLASIAASWNTLQEEFSFMDESTQAEFLTNTKDATILEARSLYSLLQNKYGELVGEDFAGLRSDLSSLSSLFTKEISSSLPFFLISFISILGLLSLFFLTKRKAR